MASSSANKQPLLIDRPLLEIISLTASTHTVGATEPGTGTQAQLLVDCTANDGAMLDDIWLIQRKDDDATPVVLFLATSAQSLGTTVSGAAPNGHFLGRVKFAATSKQGATVSLVLPRILGPVPHAGSNINNDPPQFRGLMIPRGKALWAAAEVAAANTGAPNIACQGGFY